jgi:hypothetical protein
MKLCFGIDFGGVIVKLQKNIPREDTGFLDPSNPSLIQENVFESIAEIVSICEDRVWVISKAGLRMQEKSLAWFDGVDFFSKTGLKPDHVRFCLERQDKAIICQELEISHFVDDRIHIMQILREIVPNLFLFGDSGNEKFCPPWATFVSGWAEILTLFKTSIK